jgi:hypothetical protein
LVPKVKFLLIFQTVDLQILVNFIHQESHQFKLPSLC